MSDFTAKITAVLDASKVKAELDKLTEDKKLKIDVNTNGNGVNNLNNGLQQAQKSANGLSASMKNIASTKLKIDAFNLIKEQANNAVKAVTDLNQAMTVVSMTMNDMSNTALVSLKNQSLQIAQELSIYTKTITDAVTIYANENESIASLLNKSAPTALLAAASGMQASTSADAIQGILNQFDMAEDQAMHVADVVEKLSSEISLDFSKGINDISSAIKNSGSVVDEAGMSFEKYAAIVSATAEKTRQDGSVLGNAYKTIFSRISRSKDGLTTDAEKSNAEAALSSIGISVRGLDGDLRDVSDTLDDLNMVWGTLNKSQKSYIAEQAGGLRQKDIFIATMDNYNKALQLEKEALNSSGTALEINEKRADSIQGKFQKLSATMTQLYADAVPEGAIKGMIDFGTAIADVADKLGALRGAIAAAGVMGLGTMISYVASNWAMLTAAIANPVTAIAASVGIVVSAFAAFEKAEQAAYQSASELSSGFVEQQDSIESYKNQITELKDALDSGTLNEEQAYAAKSQLYDIQTQLISTFGQEASGIDLVNGSLTTQLNLLDSLSSKKAKDYLQDIDREYGIDKVTNAMEKNKSYYIGSISAAYKDEIAPLLDKYGIALDDAYLSGDEYQLHFTGDVTDVKEKLTSLRSDINDIQDEGLRSLVKDSLYPWIDQALNEADNTIDKYDAIYNSIKQAQLLADESAIKTPYDTAKKEKSAGELYTDYADAVNKFNEAIISGDYSKIDEAREKFENVKTVVDDFTSTDGGSGFKGMFDSIAEGLNEASLKSLDFKRSLEDGDSTLSKYATNLKNLNFDKIDFLNAYNTDGVQKGEYSVRALATAADEAGISVETLADLLVELGYVSEPVAESTNGTADSASDAQNAFDALSESVSKYAENLSNVQDILNSQSTGKSISLDDYNSENLKDYQSALEYVNGAMQLNAEKVREIAMAKAEEEKANIATNKAIEQSQYLKNAGEIEKYREQLRTATDLTDAQRTAINDSISALLSENATIANTCSQYDIMAASINEATSAYQHWLNAQNASQTGDMFDSSLSAWKKVNDTLNKSDSDSYGRIGNADYKAALDFIVPESVDRTDETAINEYLNSLQSYLTFDENGNADGLDIAGFCQKAAEAGLMVLDEAGEGYRTAGNKTMQDFADGLGLSLPLVQAMFGEMQEFGAEFDWGNDGIKTLGDLGVAANESAEALRNLKGNENLKIAMDVSGFDDAELACKTLDDTIKEMQNLKDPEINPSVDASQVEHANTVIEYCIAQKQLLNQPAVMTVDSSQVTGELGEALSLLQQFQQAQNQLEVQTAIGADTSEAESQVTELTGRIEALSPSIKAQIGLDDTSTEGITTYIEGLDAEAIVNFGVDSSLVDAYQSAEHKAKGTTEWDNDTSKVDAWASQNHQSDGTVRWYNDISLVKTQFTATGTINWTNTTPPTGGTHSLNGTAHSSGTAHANGNWGTAKGGKALMGELGTEIIVDPRTGMWYTVGDNGAEFVNVPQNAIIFNHMQSESLLKYGYVSGRGTAYASGTALFTGYVPVNNRTPGNSGGNSGGSSGYTGSSSVGVSSTPSSSGKGSDSTSKTSKKVKDFFDFIEIRISRLQRKIEKFKDKVENTYKSFSKRNESLDKEIKKITTTISAQEKAYNRYMKEADKIDLSNSLKKKIRNGDIKLASYSDDKQELIKKYQELYEKALDAKDGIDELKQSLIDASKVRFDLIVEKWDVKLQSLEHTAERLTSLIERRNAYASEHVSIDTSTKAAQDNIGTYRKLISDSQSAIEKNQKKYAELIAQLNKDLNDPNSGLKEGTTAFKERMEEIYEVENRIDALSADIIDYSNQISEAYMTMFNNLATQYSNEMDLVAHLANEYSLALQKAEAKGLIATESYYENMRQVEQNNLSLLNEELKALQEQKRKALESGEIKVDSNDYYEMTKQINDISESIMEAELNIIEFNNSIREVKWKQFDYARDSVSNLNDEISFLVDLLGDEKLIDDKGKFTDEGLATLGLYGTSYNVLMAEADKYAEEIKKINQEIANDPANTKLLERQQELLKSQQSLILSANDQKQAIVDLVENGINKELSSMKELIQTYTETLDKEKELFDFQKRVKEQAKNIAELEKQLSAYQNDISEETKSKVQKLKVELESAKEDLEETQYEYMISEQKKMLDELYNDLEKTLNSRLDDVDALIEEMIATANKNAVTINETLQSATKDVGYTMTEEMDSIWSQAAASNVEIQSAITMYGEQFSTKQTATNEALGSIEKKIDAMILEAKRQADEAAAQIEADKKKQEQADKEASDKGEGNGTKQDAQNAVKPSTEVKTENELVLGSDKVKMPEAKPLGDSSASSKSTQGDGKVQVGDKVKYASGSYHAASDGSGASGSMHKGKQVYVTKIKSGSKYPYHISTGKKLGSGDLGWLKKSQISGYASGLRKAVKEEDAWINEIGSEIIVSPSKNAILTEIKPGDSVLNATAVDNIWKMANDPYQFLSNLSIPEHINVGVPEFVKNQNSNSTVINNFDNITLPSVKNYEEFLYAMQHDKRAEQLIQSMTIDLLAGKKNGKQRFNF